MLDAMRRSAGGLVAKILIALLVVSFGIWGIADIFTGFRQDTVATVGEANVTTGQFQSAYTREVQNLSQRIGQPLSRSQARDFGIPGQVLGRLIAEAAFDHVAKTLRIGVSDQTLVREIQSDPAFAGPDGRFDRNRLGQLLYANELTEDDYVQQRLLVAKRRQVAEAVSGGTQPPEVLLQAAHRYRNEERTVRYVALDAAALGPVEAPSDEALTAYFEENKATYAAPEYRKLTLLTVDPGVLARPQEVTDEEARAAYDSAGDRFGTPERRRILQLTYPDRAAADVDAARLASGTSFETLVADRGLAVSDVDLGLLTRDKLIDPVVAEAAFQLPEGDVSAVIDGRLGPHIVKVADVEPAAVQPFEAVKDELKGELATRSAESEVLALHDEIEDARAGGATLAEIAERFKLTLTTIDAVAIDGTDKADRKVDLPEAPRLLPEAFASDVADEAPPVQVGTRGFVWYDVAEITPPRDRALDEIRARVVADWQGAQVAERLAARAEELAAKVKAGADLATVAAEAGLELTTSEPFTREGGELPAPVVQAAFSGPLDTVATADGADGTKVVLQVASVSTPAFFAEAGDMQQLSGELTDMLATSLISQFVSGVQNSIGVQINQAALANAVGVNEGS